MLQLSQMKKMHQAHLNRILKDTKECSRCKKTLPLESFTREPRPHKSKTGRQSACKDCYKISQKNFREKNPEKYKEIGEKRRLAFRNNRLKIIEAYGGKCVCCGERQWQFLTVDHILGGGHKHRKEINKESGSAFYTWIIKNNYPKGFQLLCYNCNCAKGAGIECPHTAALAKMSKAQEKHLLGIKNDFLAEVDKKYRDGQARHGGNLFDLGPLQLVTEALNEALDQVTYLHTLREVILKNIKT